MQRSAQKTVQHRRIEQEIPQIGAQAVEYLLTQIVGDVAVGSGEGFEEGPLVPALAQRQRGELKARDPAFRTVMHGFELRTLQRRAADALNEIGHLVEFESEVRGIELQQFVLQPELAHAQRYARAARDDQRDGRRQMANQPVKPVVYTVIVQEMEVVEHQQQLSFVRVQIVQQRSHDRVRRYHRATLGLRKHAAAESRVGPVKRGGHVAHEAKRIVVFNIETEPCATYT